MMTGVITRRLKVVSLGKTFTRDDPTILSQYLTRFVIRNHYVTTANTP